MYMYVSKVLKCLEGVIYFMYVCNLVRMQKLQLTKIESSRNKYFWMRLLLLVHFHFFIQSTKNRWEDQSDK